MDNSALVTPEQRDAVYAKLADAMIRAMEAGAMDDTGSQQSSQFVLDRLETLSSREELMVFLEELSNRWPVYKEVYLSFKAEEVAIQDNTQLQQAQQQLGEIQQQIQQDQQP